LSHRVFRSGGRTGSVVADGGSAVRRGWEARRSEWLFSFLKTDRVIGLEVIALHLTAQVLLMMLGGWKCGSLSSTHCAQVHHFQGGLRLRGPIKVHSIVFFFCRVLLSFRARWAPHEGLYKLSWWHRRARAFRGRPGGVWDAGLARRTRSPGRVHRGFCSVSWDTPAKLRLQGPSKPARQLLAVPGQFGR